jgi:hypothetical protein
MKIQLNEKEFEVNFNFNDSPNKNMETSFLNDWCRLIVSFNIENDRKKVRKLRIDKLNKIINDNTIL